MILQHTRNNNEHINKTLHGIKLSLEVYNSTNNLIGLTQGAPTYTILEPGQSSTFEILSDVGRLNGFDHYIIKTGYHASFSWINL